MMNPEILCCSLGISQYICCIQCFFHCSTYDKGRHNRNHIFQKIRHRYQHQRSHKIHLHQEHELKGTQKVTDGQSGCGTEYWCRLYFWME